MGAKNTVKLPFKVGSCGDITKSDSQKTQTTMNCSEPVIINYNNMDYTM